MALRRPIDGATVSEVLAKVERGDAPWLDEACPGVSSALASVAAKAMSVRPEGRYAGVGALAEDVETVLDGRTPLADHASLARQFVRFYFARYPGMNQLRVVDIDLWALASFLVGAGLALLSARRLERDAWWLVGVGLVVSLPPTLRWPRLRRTRRRSEPP